MEDRRADVAGGADQLGFALQLGARAGTRSGANRARAGAAAIRRVSRIASAATRAIFVRRQVVRPDRGHGAGLGRGGAHLAAAGRAQVADRGGERRKRVQRLVEAVEAQRLDMIFEIGGGEARVAAGEGAQLRGCHGQRPASGTGRTPPPWPPCPSSVPARWFMVIVPWTLNTSRSCRWSCRLPPTPGSSCRTVMPELLQDVAGADAGQLEQQGRSRSRPPRGPPPAARSRSAPGRRRRNPTPVQRAPIEHEPACLRTGQHAQVRPAAGGTQERLGGGPADAAPLGHLEIAAALVVAPVEVVGLGDAALLGARRETRRGSPTTTRGGSIRHSPPAPWNSLAPCQWSSDRLNRGSTSSQRPARVAELPPVIVVGRLAAHVDHAVDRGAAAEHLAARIVQRAAVEPGIGLGLQAPVGARIAHGVEVADGHVDPEIAVAAAGLEQQHPVARIGRQAVGQDAAGGAGADHDIVEFAQQFRHRPPAYLGWPGASMVLPRLASRRRSGG